MAVEISGSAVEQFCKKLEGFSASLSDEERTLLKSMMGSGLSSQDLEQVQGGAGGLLQARSHSYAALAPTLRASFFARMISCW
jgi:hypothetical protein